MPQPNDQRLTIDRLSRRGQGSTAERVAAMNPEQWHGFKLDLLVRFAAEGRFPPDSGNGKGVSG